MSIQLEVKYQDKERVKEKGGFWDTQLKTWYIPDNKKIVDFSEWIPENADVIIKSPILVAKNSRACWKCNKETPLISIGGLKIIISDYVDEDSDKIDWRVENELCLFSDITYLPKNILNIVQTKFTFFKYTYSNTIKRKYWANNCIHCNSLQGDFFNHNEPGGAFCPMSIEEGNSIKLFKIDYKHDIPIIGGYSFDDYGFIKTDDIKNIDEITNTQQFV